MHISIQSGSFSEFQTINVKTIHTLADIAMKNNYSLSTYKDNYRNMLNFEQTTAIGLDIDNTNPEEYLSLESARLVFAKYKHILMTSKSHGIEKNGKTVDRFRVILFLNKPITDAPTFYSTWHRLKAQWDFIDHQCKDPSRLWFKSKSLVHIEESGILITPIAPKLAQPKKRYTEVGDSNRRGALASSTINFLVSGSLVGEWNHALYKAAKDMQQQMWSKDEATMQLSIPTALEGNKGELDESDLQTIDSAYNTASKYAPRYVDKVETRNVINQCKMIINLADINHVNMVDLGTGERYDMERAAVREVLGPKDFKAFMETHSIHANFLYEPGAKTILFKKSNGLTAYNQYTPPIWMRKEYYNRTPIHAPKSLPKIIDSYLDHLLDGDQASRSYLLDWLHTTMTSRNYTMLTAIGEQGIGKGVLGHMMCKLVGEENYVQTRDDIFKKSFNNQLDRKKLVYVDELALDKKEAHDRLKHMVNDTLEIEAKGKDTKYITNHASFYISSNHMDAIKLEPGDRRFSIIQLTDKKILERFTSKEINEGILSPGSIKAFGAYLLNRKVTRDMRIPFKSDRFYEVMDAGLKAWQRFILEDMYQKHTGTRVPLSQVQEQLKVEFPAINPPGRNKIHSLTKAYPDKLQFIHGTDGRLVEFKRVEPK